MRLFIPFRDAPIRHKLMLIGLLTTALALFSVSIILVARDWVNWRDKTVSEMNIYAALIGANAAPSIIFGDYDAATEVLQTLRGNPNIVDAVLFDREGEVFVRYRVPGHPDSAFPRLGSNSSLLDFGQLVVSKPVVLKGEVWGTVYLESDLRGLYADIKRHTLLTFIAAAGVFAVVLFLFSRLQKTIVDPITTLSSVMRRVSAQQDYAVRVPVHGKDEVGMLAGAFNDMLAQIQTRDEALEKHREHLEEEVVQRTVALKEANRLLEQELGVRKLAEEAMDRLKRDLAMILESAGEGICTMDANGSHVLVNPSAARMFGYEVEEMIGRNSHSLWHYEKADGTPYPAEECLIYATMRDGVVRRSESEVFWRKDGTSFPVEYVSTPIRNNGAITGAVVVFRDISERKNAEAQLRESEARYRGIFEYADDIIYLLEPDGTFRSLSPSFERVTGWRVEEWIGKPFAPVIHPDDLPYATDIFRKTLAGQSVLSFRLRIARKSGEYFDADLSITPLGRGAATGALGIARDVTERKQVEEKIHRLNEELEIKVQERTRQLLEAQEALVRKEKLAVLGQVAGSVGHELRNPLGVMSNAVYFLQTVLADADDSVKDYLKIIKDEIVGSERIVSDLLDSVRTKPPRAETTGVHELLEQTLRKLSIPASVTVKLDIPETLSPMHVDPQQIHQVFRNLISNGVEAMPEGGVLEIRAVENKSGGNLTVSVRDSGIGMTPEQMGNLFQPLFTTKARGIGLGLVVVKNLTQANGGTVNVESEAGKGTVFAITLPVADETGGLI
ncbi:MAG: PAS domain S-box protein [Gallionella sp.]|nr:PAS domain S-box protein [Gallionella sp.]MCK9353015.1 PAS domain S-box protein [Gallionella sp.]